MIEHGADGGAGGLAERALALASSVHKDQVDKSGEPYLGHCRRVMDKLDSDDERAVAALHDIIEDTPTTADDLRKLFPGHIVDAVVALTRVDGVAPEVYYKGIKADPLALQVKLADLHDNLDPQRVRRLDLALAARLRAKYGKAYLALSDDS